MSEFHIGLWNANGLQATAVNEILNYCTSSTALLLLKHGFYHLPSYAQTGHSSTPMVSSKRRILRMPRLHATNIPYLSLSDTTNTSARPSLLSIKDCKPHVICLYFPPPLSNNEVLSVLNSIPFFN